MNPDEITRFVHTYRRFYLNETDSQNNQLPLEYERYGLPRSVEPIDQDLETYIISKINEGIYDAKAFAWKAGKANWVNGQFAYINPLPNRWVNGNGCAISISRDSPAFSLHDFESYLREKDAELELDWESIDYNNPDDRKNLYIAIKDTYNLYNFGTVNIINLMFFKSKGRIPIYDYFAHVGVKALYFDKSPLEVYVGSCPGKNDHPRGRLAICKEYYLAINVLEEYIWLLAQVFPSKINEDNMYIPRPVDQALWVYGHATERFPVMEN